MPAEQRRVSWAEKQQGLREVRGFSGSNMLPVFWAGSAGGWAEAAEGFPDGNPLNFGPTVQGYIFKPTNKIDFRSKQGGLDMPRGDRTGPAGMGPLSGRGAGFCAGLGAPATNQGGWGGFLSPGWGRGTGWRTGGRGFCHRLFGAGFPAWLGFGPPGASPSRPDPEMEKQFLQDQADGLQSQLNWIKKRLGELGRDTSAE